MYELDLILEQQNREKQDDDAIDYEADQNCDTEADGEWDAIIGADPAHPELEAYWHGFQSKLRQIWCEKLGRKLESEF